jgi:hypothetical protein
MRWYVNLICFFCLSYGTAQTSTAQGLLETPDSLSIPRVKAAVISESVITAGSLTGLYFAWYAQFDQQPFRFFNDWDGWQQMDKTGHSVSTYQIAANLNRIHRWTGMKPRAARWLSSGLSFGYLATVEVMDGFSAGWGFSLYDFGFNTAGIGLFHLQDAVWGAQAIKLKFSFSPSGLTRQNDLGTNFVEAERARALYGTSIFEQWLKDYNGQTHWMSANLWMLAGKPTWMPRWIDFSVGYSANGLLGAESNSWQIEDAGVQSIYTSSIPRERQLLFSLDLNLDHVDLPKGLIWLRPVVGFFKFPFPTLEWNDRTGIGFRPFYF